MRHFDPGMTTCIVDLDMIDADRRPLHDVHHLMGIEVFYRHHIDRRDKITLAIISTEGTQR